MIASSVSAPLLLIAGLSAAGLATGCAKPATSAESTRDEPDPPDTAAAVSAAADEPTAAAAQAAPVDDGRVLPRTFDDIKFDIEPDAPFDRAMLTEEIERLVGKRIEIRGYILPSFRDKLRDFVLVRDDQECCFGPGAALYDCILVEMAPGKVAEFSTRPVAVEGVFRIEPLELAGATRAVFRMT
ncbi:MAG: hypothetical protein AAGG46_10920, partial [Planctomycetota bacterium]